MTHSEAAVKAKKRWGNSAYIRSGDKMSSPERRERATADFIATQAEIERIKEEVRCRLLELDWYQELQKQRRECAKRIAALESQTLYYRFHVGTSNGLFNEITGSGDTWEAAFAQAEARETK